MVALVADDDAFNRELLRRMLIRLGWLVDEVEGGTSAVRACESAQYDVVLLDLHMPDMSGQETARKIRNIPAPEGAENAKPTWIIAVTGADGLEDDSAGLFDGFLQKPFMLDELKSILKH